MWRDNWSESQRVYSGHIDLGGKMQEEEHGFRGEDQADKLLVNTARVTSYEMQFACDRDSRGKPMARCNARIPRHLVWNQSWTGFHRIRGHGSASETDPLSIILDHRNWYVSSLKRSRRKKPCACLSTFYVPMQTFHRWTRKATI